MKPSSNQMNIPAGVSRVTGILISANFQAFLVGGCVRDLVMGKMPKDWDITTNAKPEEIVQLFEQAEFKVVYENTFGTVMVIGPPMKHSPL
jgi:tRNA nucleotidyltransferase (CCA-adding enzyme)